MSESLSELVARRLDDLGRKRGGGPLSLKAAYEALPEDDNGVRSVSYEIIRRVGRGEHTNITDKTVDALAVILEVPADEVLRAAGQRIRLGRFSLPRRADRLDAKERRAVLAVVDAILDAGEGKAGPEHGQRSAEKSPEDDSGAGGLALVPDPEVSEADDRLPEAALDTIEGVDEEPGGSDQNES